MSNLQQRVSALVGQRDMLVSQRDDLLSAQEANKAHALTLERAKLVIQNAAQITQRQLSYRISELSSLALAHVFGEEGYSLVLRFDCKRGRTEAVLLLADKEGHEFEPLEEVGGGVWDVTSLALRISLWSLKKPRNRPTIILDEPGRNLRGQRNQERLTSLITDISHRLKIQFICVFQESWGAEFADRIFHVKRVKPAPSVVTMEE
jgi:hypothetical protein